MIDVPVVQYLGLTEGVSIWSQVLMLVRAVSHSLMLVRAVSHSMLQCWSWSAVGAGSLVAQDRTSGLRLPCLCSTMGVGRQSRRVCFGTKPDKGFLDLKSRPTRKWYGEANESWRRDPGEAVGSWTERELVAGPERQWVVGQERGQLVVGQEQRELVAGEQRGEQQKLAWKNGQGQSTPDTGQQKSEAAWDRVQRQWVKMSLIPVALWNFR